MKFKKPNFSVKIKKLSKKARVLLLLIALITIGIAGVTIYTHKDTKKESVVSCNDLTKSAVELSKQKNNKGAFDLLKAQAARCGNVSDKVKDDLKDKNKTNQYIETLVYNGNLARTAFAAGDVQQAKNAADQAAKINEAMSPDQRSQIPNQHEIMIDMYSIRAGIYHVPREMLQQ